jgi:hypothetical protein
VKLEHAQRIVETAQNLSLDVTLHKGYSGRGMYGRKTTGVVGSLGDITLCIASVAYDLGLADVSAEDFLKDMAKLSFGEMASQIIVY